MKNRFDEITKQMAQSVTRRAALKQFGVGLAAMALATVGLLRKAEAQSTCLPSGTYGCKQNSDCCSGTCKSTPHSKFFPNLPKVCA